MTLHCSEAGFRLQCAQKDYSWGAENTAHFKQLGVDGAQVNAKTTCKNDLLSSSVLLNVEGKKDIV